jgi:hypothetical protein
VAWHHAAVEANDGSSRAGSGVSSLSAARDYLEKRFASHPNVIISQSAKRFPRMVLGAWVPRQMSQEESPDRYVSRGPAHRGRDAKSG